MDIFFGYIFGTYFHDFPTYCISSYIFIEPQVRETREILFGGDEKEEKKYGVMFKRWAPLAFDTGISFINETTTTTTTTSALNRKSTASASKTVTSSSYDRG